MSKFIVTTPDAVLFDRPTSIVKAKKLAKQSWRDGHAELAAWTELGFKSRRDGSIFLWADDGCDAWDTGVTITREKS